MELVLRVGDLEQVASEENVQQVVVIIKTFLAADKDVETSLVTRSEVQEAEGSVY